MMIASPLKYHGGKSPLARRIVALFPPHTHYVEPYFGGGSVLLAKDPEGVSEVVNDRHRGLTNFWNVLQHDHAFAEFRRVMEATPFSEDEYKVADGLAKNLGWVDVPTEGPIPSRSTTACVLRAAHFFVACRQSLAGRMKAFSAITRARTRRGMNAEASAWLSAVEGLPAVHARLKRVVILNRDALDVIGQQDGPRTLFYLDPPYLPKTRSSPDVYAHEMTAEQHRDLLTTLNGIAGKFVLSGYRSEMYDEWAEDMGYHRVDFEVPNRAATGVGELPRATECVWTNFKPAEVPA